MKPLIVIASVNSHRLRVHLASR